MKKIIRNENVRMKLGISQLDLADFLGVSRSQLSMYELNERCLPGASMNKLAKLELMHLHLLEGKLKNWKKQ